MVGHQLTNRVDQSVESFQKQGGRLVFVFLLGVISGQCCPPGTKTLGGLRLT